jgi:hypothetical protein
MLTLAIAALAVLGLTPVLLKFLRDRAVALVAGARQDAAAAVDRLAQDIAGTPKS